MPNSNEDDNSQSNKDEKVDSALQEFVNKTVNAAASGRDTRMSKVFDKKLTDKLAEFKQEIADIVSSSQPKPLTEEQKKTASESSNADERIAQLQKQNEAKLKELTNKVEAAETARTAALDKANTDEERQLLTNALREHGIEGSRLKGAIALLYTEECKVGRSENNGIIFKAQRDGYTDELTLEAGVEEWLKGDGQAYLPPRAASGSGNIGGRSPIRKGQKLSRHDQLTLLGQALAGKRS